MVLTSDIHLLSSEHSKLFGGGTGGVFYTDGGAAASPTLSFAPPT